MGRFASFLARWLPPILWTAIVFGFSSVAFSATETSRIIVPLLKWLLPNAGPQTIESLHALARKLSHLVEYALLAALLFRGFKYGAHTRWNRRWAVYSLVIVVACAGADEYRQSLSTTRTGSAVDVVIDVIGAAAALCIIRFFTRRRQAVPTTNRPERERR
jgi:VanZ family protein